MIIIETCPECGHDLMQSVIATYPPINQKDCPYCGWHWEQQEKDTVLRVPFDVKLSEVNTSNECKI